MLVVAHFLRASGNVERAQVAVDGRFTHLQALCKRGDRLCRVELADDSTTLFATEVGPSPLVTSDEEPRLALDVVPLLLRPLGHRSRKTTTAVARAVLVWAVGVRAPWSSTATARHSRGDQSASLCVPFDE